MKLFKNFIRIYLSCLLVVSNTHWAMARAKATNEQLTNQVLANVGLDYLFHRLNQANNLEKFKALITEGMTPQGKKFATKYLASLKVIPNIERLNRGFTFEYEKKVFNFGYDDFRLGKMTVNGVPFTLDYGQPLEKHLEEIGRRLQQSKYGLLNLVIQPAEAVVWWIPLLVGFALGLAPVAYNTYIQPILDSRYCKNASADSYPDFVRCKEYLNWAMLRKKNDQGLPNANPEKISKLPELASLHECPKKIGQGADKGAVLSDFVVSERDKDSDELFVKQTVSYKGTKPYRMVAETFKPTHHTVTYDLDDENKILRVYNTEELFLSRDPKDAERMKGISLSLFDPFDKNLKSVTDLYSAKCEQGTTVEEAATLASTARMMSSASAPRPPEGRK